jgi:Skp family chaperone for outer membrane proteins
VRTSRIVAAGAVIVFVAVGMPNLHAQNQPPPRSGAPVRQSASAPVSSANGIAVIDVTYILEHYSRLKQAMEVYKRDAQSAEDALKKERDGIARRAEELKTRKPGTPDYKRIEEELTKAESDWKLKVAAQRRDFAERESRNYLRAYQELSAAVKAYAQHNGISLVLRFNGARIDPNNREMVQMEVFKMVMYYDASIDITAPILETLNRSAAIAAPPGAQPRRH